MPDLPSLIRDAITRGATLQSLEAASDRIVKYQRWGQLSRGERLSEFPEPKTLRAIAKALGVTDTLAVISTAKALGLDVSRRGSALGQRLPAEADHLPPAVQSAIVQLVSVIAAEGSAQHPDMDETGATGPRTAIVADVDQPAKRPDTIAANESTEPAGAGFASQADQDER